MAPSLYVLVLVGSAALLFWSANRLTHGIITTARYLRWREFVIAFFVMAVVASFPNLFIGISSALHGIPELSFGDVVGNSVVDLTLVAALAVFFGKELTAKGALIQTSSFFTIGVALLPLALIGDKELGRGDALVLLGVFALYSVWLFSKRREYTEIFEVSDAVAAQSALKGFGRFLESLWGIVLAIVFLVLAAEGAVRAVSFFAKEFHLALPMLGILVVGLGSALPEITFTIVSARKGKSSIILGDLMGTVIVMATLVLGIVALIRPIQVADFSPFAIARVFLVVSALFFLIFLRTGRKITRREGFVLFSLYVGFVLAEII